MGIFFVTNDGLIDLCNLIWLRYQGGFHPKENLIKLNRSNTYAQLFLTYSQNYTIYTRLKYNKK